MRFLFLQFNRLKKESQSPQKYGIMYSSVPDFLFQESFVFLVIQCFESSLLLSLYPWMQAIPIYTTVWESCQSSLHFSVPAPAVSPCLMLFVQLFPSFSLWQFPVTVTDCAVHASVSSFSFGLWYTSLLDDNAHGRTVVSELEKSLDKY